MPFSISITLFIFATAWGNPWTKFDFGTLQISTANTHQDKFFNETTKKYYVNFRGSKVVINRRRTVFVHDGNGTFQSFDTGRYINIDSTALLTVRPSIHYGFSLKSIPDATSCIMHVAYLDNDEFELCGNGSIGYQSGCENSTKVTIIFHDIFPNDWIDE